MPTTWETHLVKFEGGWITTLGRLEQGIQAPGSATFLQNFEVSVEGGYTRILGYEKYSSTAVGGTGSVIGVIAIDAAKCLASRGNKYYLSSGTTWTEKATAAVTGSTRVRYDTYNFNGTQKFVMVDSLNDPAFYDTAAETVTYDTSAPSDVTGAGHVRVFKNHIFFGKNNLLNFTAPYTDNDYNTGNGAGVINVGSPITGLIVFREQLIIFSLNKIQRLIGDTSENFVLEPIAENTGCLCPNTIQEVGGDIMYLGPDGVRYLSATERNNDFGLQRASANIQNQITRMINTDCGYASIVIRSKNQYRLFNYLSSVPRAYAEGYIATKFSDQSVDNISWSKTVGLKVYAADSRQLRDTEVILFSSDDGYVYRMESGNSFDGEGIPFLFETPYMPITDPRLRKTIYKHTLYTSVGGNFSVEAGIRFDYNESHIIQPATFTLGTTGTLGNIYGTAEAVYGTSVYSAILDELYLNNTVGSGFVVAVRYSGEEIIPPFTLDYVVLEYSQNERR